MKNIPVTVLFLFLLFNFVFSQTDNTEAAENIFKLFNGSLVIKLKTNEKSIKAYRESGDKKLADKLEKELKEQNLRLMRAFLKYFTFTEVYFIKAPDSRKFLDGDTTKFLNGYLEYDSSIKFPKGNFFFAELGPVMDVEVADEYHYKGINKTRESNNPAYSKAIVIKDSTNHQLKEPFPFFGQFMDEKDAFGYAVMGLIPLIGYEVLNSVQGENKKNKPYCRSVLNLNSKLVQFYRSSGQQPVFMPYIKPPPVWETQNPNKKFQVQLEQVTSEISHIDDSDMKFKSPYSK